MAQDDKTKLIEFLNKNSDKTGLQFGINDEGDVAARIDGHAGQVRSLMQTQPALVSEAAGGIGVGVRFRATLPGLFTAPSDIPPAIEQLRINDPAEALEKLPAMQEAIDSGMFKALGQGDRDTLVRLKEGHGVASVAPAQNTQKNATNTPPKETPMSQDDKDKAELVEILNSRTDKTGLTFELGKDGKVSAPLDNGIVFQTRPDLAEKATGGIFTYDAKNNRLTVTDPVGIVRTPQQPQIDAFLAQADEGLVGTAVKGDFNALFRLEAQNVAQHGTSFDDRLKTVEAAFGVKPDKALSFDMGDKIDVGVPMQSGREVMETLVRDLNTLGEKAGLAPKEFNAGFDKDGLILSFSGDVDKTIGKLKPLEGYLKEVIGKAGKDEEPARPVPLLNQGARIAQNDGFDKAVEVGKALKGITSIAIADDHSLAVPNVAKGQGHGNGRA